jgi:DMSO/TMAO reductase YedYZ heme-binding membrane subunit
VHLTTSPVDWYAVRAAGVVAYVLLSAVVALGLTMAGRRRLERWPRFALEDVHRFGGLLVGTFVAVHVVTIAIDSYLRFSVAALLVPFASTYKPLPVALGVVAAELLVALAVTNRLRHRRLPYASWRRLHYLNFAVWGAATVHGIGAGTDRNSVWLLALYGVSVAVVAVLLALRLPRLAAVPRAPAVAAAAAVVLVVALAFGPFRSQRAPWNGAAFREALEGEILRDSGPTAGIVSMAGRAAGKQRVLVRADLLVNPERLVSTAFQMEYLASGAICRGAVTHVESYGFTARCRMPDGTHRTVRAHWEPGETSELTGGTIASSA